MNSLTKPSLEVRNSNLEASLSIEIKTLDQLNSLLRTAIDWGQADRRDTTR